MPKKIRRTKGQAPKQTKTNRRQSDIGVRQAIVNSIGLTLSTEEAAKLLKSDRYIGDKSIYWGLTICRMTRYRSVKNKKEREEGI
jgi:hypothetical protein